MFEVGSDFENVMFPWLNDEGDYFERDIEEVGASFDDEDDNCSLHYEKHGDVVID